MLFQKDSDMYIQNLLLFTGTTLQEQSAQRLWLCLSNNDLEERHTADTSEQQLIEHLSLIMTSHELQETNHVVSTGVSANDTYIGQCTARLYDAGMPESVSVVVYGHSYGAVMALAEVRVSVYVDYKVQIRGLVNIIV